MVLPVCWTEKVNVMKNQTPHMIIDRNQHGRIGMRSERGVVLLVVIVLSAIVLAVMTSLIYMITVGTQVTGIEKRYRTAHDAAFGGWAAFGQLLATRGSSSDVSTFFSSLASAGLNPSITNDAACTGTTEAGLSKYGIEAKMMTRSTTWSAACGTNITTTASSADLTMTLGSPKFNVYAKIVNTFPGNTASSGAGLFGQGVVFNNSGVIAAYPMPYLYAIEVDAENTLNPAERARLSILYQY